MPNQDDGTRSRIAADVPSNHKTAIVKFAHDRTTAFERITMADVVREAISEYLANHSGDLPEEAIDDLDDDLIANGGGDDE